MTVTTVFRHLATGLAAGLLLASTGAVAADPPIAAVYLHGSASLMPAAQKVAEAYMARHPGQTIVLRPGDSGPGLKSLLDGTTDIAMVSAVISDDVLKRAKGAGLALQSRPVAMDAIVPVVNPANPVSGLSLEQLGMVYRGAVTDWEQVGAHGGERSAGKLWDRRQLEAYGSWGRNADAPGADRDRQQDQAGGGGRAGGYRLCQP